jgi:hypothetical protein
MAGYLVKQESVCHDKPWRCGPEDQDQQNADKAQYDQAVAIFFSFYTQVSSSLHNVASIGNSKCF